MSCTGRALCAWADDRFRVMPNGKFYCRRCLPDGKDKDRFKELLRVIGLANDTDERSRTS